MVLCAKCYGATYKSHPRLNEPSGNSGQLLPIIEAYAEASGWHIKFIAETLEYDPSGGGLSRDWPYFKQGFYLGVAAAIKAIEATQPPDTTPWDCVDAIRARIGHFPQLADAAKPEVG